MPSEDFTIPIGKYDWIWATYDRGPKAPDPAKPLPTLAIMIHGFPGDSLSYGNVFGDLSDTLVKDGFHTLRFDMRGCGQSDKAAKFFTLKTAHEDCLVAIRWAVKLGYKKLVLVSEGFGAVIALTALIDTIRPSVAGMIFLWPILERRQSWLSTLIPLADTAELRGENHIALDNANIGLSFVRELRDYNLMPLLSRLTMPLQIHHGTADTRASLGALKALLATTKTGKLDLIPHNGGDHGLKTNDHRRALLAQARVFMQSL